MVKYKIEIYKIVYSLYLVIAPFIYFMPKVWPFNLNVVTVLGLLLIGIGLISVFPMKLYTNGRFFLICCSFLVALSIFYSATNFGAALVMAESYSICIFLLSLIVFSEPNRLKDYFKYLKLFSITGALAGLVSLAIKANVVPIPLILIDRFIAGGRTGSVVDGAISVLGQVCALTLVFTKCQSNKKIWSLMYILCLTNVVLSGFRTYMVISLLIFFVMLFGVGVIEKVKVLSMAAVLVVALCLLDASFYRDSIGRFAGLIEGKSLISDESMKWRLIERDSEIDIINKNPFAGSGWGLSSRAEVSRQEMGTLSAFGHNQYTSLSARMGIPVMILFWGLWFGWLVKSFKLYRRKKGDERIFYLGAFSIILSILLGGWTQNFFLMTLFAPALAVYISPVINERCLY